MSIELSIQARPNAKPRIITFEEPTITIGRDPTSVLRLEMGADLEVSTRHAEISREDDAYLISDRESTNGTWVNGARLAGARRLHPGDVINLGRRGPEIRVMAVNDDLWHQTVESKVRLPPVHEHPKWRHGTREWLVGVVETRTRTLTYVFGGVVGIMLALAVAAWVYVRTLGEDPQVWREVTAPAIWRANDDAVVLIESEIPGECARGCEGTGFAIATNGLIATNRHVVEQRGAKATRIRVKFANTRSWLSASLVRAAVDPTVDVALIRVDKPGPYPAVIGVSDDGPDLPVGSSVIAIGFPLGSVLRMEGAGSDAVAKTTMTIGSISKVLSDLIQIDAFADHGSSGSPVFDRHGHAIGIVSGGEGEKIVYVVPSSRIRALEKAEQAARKSVGAP